MEILMKSNEEKLYQNRVTPWEGLGVKVEGTKSSAEAIRKAGLDWTVTKRTLVDKVSGLDVPRFFATVREQDDKVLGIVSDKRYVICQNIDAFDFTDKLLGEGVTYETAGSLLGGRRIWLLARLDSREILGDEVTPYIIFTNAHDGSAGIKAAITPVRALCQNAIDLAFKRADRSWSCTHTGNLQDKLKEAANTLWRVDKYFDVFDKEMNAIVEGAKWDESEVDRYISYLLPINKEDGNRKKANTISLRDELKTRMYYAPDLDRFPIGGYRFINAVSDMVTHTENHNNTAYYRENMFIRTINGNRMIDKAYNIVMDSMN